MIRIDTPSDAAFVESLAADADADLPRLAALLAQRELKSADFKGSIYSAAEVREALWRSQHRKCCFCEHAYERRWSTVEHFRPKTSVRGADNVRTRPGYWWLAYELRNLYFCCSNCNSPKSDRFPIAAGERRYEARELPWESAYAEPHLIVDPGAEDPSEHLTFRRAPGHGRWRIQPLTPRGLETIGAANLDRDDLNELRDQHCALVLEPVAALRTAGNADVEALATKLAGPKAPFSLLARAVLEIQ